MKSNGHASEESGRGLRSSRARTAPQRLRQSGKWKGRALTAENELVTFFITISTDRRPLSPGRITFRNTGRAVHTPNCHGYLMRKGQACHFRFSKCKVLLTKSRGVWSAFRPHLPTPRHPSKLALAWRFTEKAAFYTTQTAFVHSKLHFVFVFLASYLLRCCTAVRCNCQTWQTAVTLYSGEKCLRSNCERIYDVVFPPPLLQRLWS